MIPENYDLVYRLALSIIFLVSIKGAKSVLLNVTGGVDMTLFEINEIVDVISKEVGQGANIVFGAIINEEMHDEIIVSVIATKCEKYVEEEVKQKELPRESFLKKDNIKIEEQFKIKDKLVDEKDLEIPAFLRKRMNDNILKNSPKSK